MTCWHPREWAIYCYSSQIQNVNGSAHVSDEGLRIKQNVKMIREYLRNDSPFLKITSETSIPGKFHKFVVFDSHSGKSHTLQVRWFRLSDPSNTPATIRLALVREDVVTLLRESAKIFSW